MKALKKIREQVEKGGQNQGIFVFIFSKSQSLYILRLSSVIIRPKKLATVLYSARPL